MAISKYRRALERSLQTQEEKEVIQGFYDMSYADFLRYYSTSIDDLIAGIDRTRLAGRPYQKENILQRAQKLKGDEPVSGFITQLPAGAGKTEIFFQTLLKNAKEVTVGDEVKLITPPTVILVPSEDLLNQVCDELHKRFPNLVVGKRNGKEFNIQPLTVYIYDSFMNDVQNTVIRPSDVKLAILDEAHRGLSDTRFKELNKFKGVTLLDAYSASPAFDANKNLYELLGKDSVIPSPSDGELTDMGHLAKCHNIILTIKIKKKDVPPEIANDSQKYGDFLQRLKIEAALEFYKNYEDPETGQRTFGKPVVGFTRYVRDAQVAEDVFQEALADMAANDRAAAKVLKPYSHYTQTLSRSLGDEAVDTAFERILSVERVEDLWRKKPERRKPKPERALATFTSKMAREGTDVPDWKVALGIHTGTIVDEIQTRGRVRRKKGDELSVVLDCVVEEDGKILGNPVTYATAIGEPGIVKGVQTVTAGPELIGLAAAELLEFKNQDEMRTLVLGEGSAAVEKTEEFDRLWKRIQTHGYKQSRKPVPEPYVLDGDPVKHKIIFTNGDNGNGGKQHTEFRISKTAVDQFRRELGIPGQLNSLWLAENAFEQAVIGSGHKAEHYRDAFKRMVKPALTHFVSGNNEPYALKEKPILMQSRLDEDGSLVPAFHHSAVMPFKEALDVLPGKTRRYLNQDEFAAAVLDQVEEPEKYKGQIATLWKEARAHYDRHHRPGQRTNFDIGGHRVEVAKCLDAEGQTIFCIERKGVRAARRHLGIPDITFDIDGIEWSAEQSDIIRITKRIEEGEYPNIEDTGMLIARKMARSANTSEPNVALIYQALQEEWRKREPVFNYERKYYVPTKGGEDPLKVEVSEKSYVIPIEQCGFFRSGDSTPFCVHESQSRQFEVAPEVTPGMLPQKRMAEKIHVADLSSVFVELEKEWKKREPIFDYAKQHYKTTKGGTEPIKVKVENRDFEIPVEMCGTFRSGMTYHFFIHESQSKQFETAPEVTNGMLSIAEMAKKAGTNGDNISLVYKALAVEWQKRVPIFDYELQEYKPTKGGDQPIKVIVNDKAYQIPIQQCGTFKSGGTAFYVHESQSKKFEIAPEITVGMLNRNNMAAKAKVGDVSPIYNVLEAEWKKREPVFDYEKEHYVFGKGGTEPIKAELEGRLYQVPMEQCGIFRSDRGYPFCVHESQFRQFESAPDITADMLSMTGMAELAGVTSGTLSPVYKMLEDEWKKRAPLFDYDKQHYTSTKGGNSPLIVRVEDKTYTIPVEKCGIFKSTILGGKAKSGRPFFYVHESQLAQFAPAPKVTEGMLPTYKMAKEARIGEPTIKQVYGIIEDEWKKRKPIFDYESAQYKASVGGEQPLTIPAGKEVFEIPVAQCGVFKSGSLCPFLVHESQSGTIQEIVAALRDTRKEESNEVVNDSRADLKKARPTSSRRSPADMNDEERLEQKRGGNKRG